MSSPDLPPPAAPPPPAPVPPPPTEDMYVVDSPYEVANWRPLVNWILIIPHLIIQYGLRALSGVAGFVYWVILLFTGRLNSGLFGVLAMSERYNYRVTSYLFGFTEEYPPFDFNLGPQDDHAHPPIRINVPEPPEEQSRVAALNFFFAIPHYFVLAVFGIGAFFVLFVGWFAVLFTGKWPQGMRDYLVRVGNYWFRVWVYVTMLTREYPRFGL